MAADEQGPLPPFSTTSDEERERLAQRLRQLTLGELVDVLRRVLPRHADEDGESILVLAEAFRSRPDPDDEPEEPYVELVAWPARDLYDGSIGPPWGLLESGRCDNCRALVTSTVKRAHCPVCGTLCGLT
ncbi:hypothetical protein [Thermomonospora cellulosilytica]|uniref:Uncharacterized protein n=1 Tax=Thermomonospora cellulosilytica TaxID=1411118 RepID=A0A7W3MVG7_9ACTN|nr:hypothetical protein [Thermomonospora cellulosilytica]MBA9002599.1 hypothetical protein [Thermomonospora cellulosilytica]